MCMSAGKGLHLRTAYSFRIWRCHVLSQTALKMYRSHLDTFISLIVSLVKPKRLLIIYAFREVIMHARFLIIPLTAYIV